MSGFRLHIDVPLGGSEAEALEKSKRIVEFISNMEAMRSIGVEQVNYRLGHDEDREVKNYMVKTPSGHATKNKSRIFFSEDLTGV